MGCNYREVISGGAIGPRSRQQQPQHPECNVMKLWGGPMCEAVGRRYGEEL